MKLSKTEKDIQWSFISLVTSSIAHFLLRIVLGKDLGAYGLGIYTLIFTIYIMGTRFVPFGIGAALTRYVPMNEGNPLKIKEYISIGVIFSFITGLIFCVTMYVLSDTIAITFFHNPEMIPLIKVTAFCFPFMAIQKTVLGAINGFQKMNFFAFINILQNTSVFILSVVLVLFFEMNVLGAVLGLVIPTIIVGLISLYFVRDQIEIIPRLSGTATIKITTREILWFGFYSVLSASVSTLMTNIDSLMIGYLMTETDVGYYSVAIIFVEGLILIPESIQRVTTPRIARYYKENDYESIIKLIKLTMSKTFILTTFLSLLLVIFGKSLIALLFKEEFLPAYMPLVILLIGYGIRSPFVSIGGTLSSIGKVDVSFRVNLVSSVANTILNFLLIPEIGLAGAATATSISLIISVAIALYFIKRYTYISNNNRTYAIKRQNEA